MSEADGNKKTEMSDVRAYLPRVRRVCGLAALAGVCYGNGNQVAKVAYW